MPWLAYRRLYGVLAVFLIYIVVTSPTEHFLSARGQIIPSLEIAAFIIIARHAKD